jgi:hypothetical protein
LKNISIISASLCAIVTLFVVWFVRNLYIVDAVDSVAFFESTVQLQQLFLDDVQAEKTTTIRVVYFWQNHCPCDHFTKPHFLLLINQYQQLASNVKFYFASIDNSSASADLEGIDRLPDSLLNRVRGDVKATPSVGIWDSNGQLVYFGPHSLGYICNNDTSFVKKVVDALLNKQTVSAAGVMGDGCFCPVEK